jgi:uncharacterized membrane protein (DUF106 family)
VKTVINRKHVRIETETRKLRSDTMKSLHKISFAILFALVAILTVSTIANSASAASPLSIQVTITTNNRGVTQESTYTGIITNNGPVNLGAANITVPLAGIIDGYNNLKNLAVTQQPGGQNWNISNQNGVFILLTGSGQGLAPGQSITFTFDVTNPKVEANYVWFIQASQNATAEGLNNPETALNINTAIVIASILPAMAILGIAVGIAFLNSGINRGLIGYFIGWEQYRVMQKEMNEYRAETMAAARANDKKQMEKLKKKKSQIDNMQSKMMKPQMVQFGISFVYIVVWLFVLTPTFGNSSVIYIPGVGPLSVFYWYPLCSFFLGLLTSRIIGIMPIET